MTEFDLSLPGARSKAWRDLALVDHGFLRLTWDNAHWISDEMLRTNQPWPWQLKRWAERGLKSVVNLRGNDTSMYALEVEACERNGLVLHDHVTKSRHPPSAEHIRGAKALFETLEYPALMHCKSGADRAGLMSVLYKHFREGQPISEARKQLHIKYLHVDFGPTGVLDYVFDRYQADAEPQGLSFYDWTQSPAYDADQIGRDYNFSGWGRFITDKILRRE